MIVTLTKVLQSLLWAAANFSISGPWQAQALQKWRTSSWSRAFDGHVERDWIGLWVTGEHCSPSSFLFWSRALNSLWNFVSLWAPMITCRLTTDTELSGRWSAGGSYHNLPSSADSFRCHSTVIKHWTTQLQQLWHHGRKSTLGNTQPWLSSAAYRRPDRRLGIQTWKRPSICLHETISDWVGNSFV